MSIETPSAELLTRLAGAVAALVEEATAEALMVLDDVVCDLYDSMDPPIDTRPPFAAVYEALRQHCDDRGVAFTRPSRLARIAKCNARTAKRALRGLEQRGLIVRIPRAAPRHRATIFQLRDDPPELLAYRAAVMREVLQLSDEIEIVRTRGLISDLCLDSMAMAAARVERAMMRRPVTAPEIARAS